MSKINDDYDEYDYLCKKYGETPQKLYSNHHDWLEARHSNKTDLSFEEYSYQADRKKAILRIEHIDKDIIKLEKEKNELRQKYNIT